MANKKNRKNRKIIVNKEIKLTNDVRYVRIFEDFKLESESILEINKVLPEKIEEHFSETDEQREETMKKFSKKEKKEFNEYLEYHKNPESTPKGFEFKQEKVFKIFSGRMSDRVFEGRFKRFVKINSLILLVSEFEYFLTRILDLTYSLKPELLKTKTKNISYEEYMNFKKIDDGVNNMIDKELDSIMQEDIDKIADIIEKKI